MITATATGTVLHDWENNGSRDSDFYEAVWTGTEFKVERTGTTSGCCASYFTSRPRIPAGSPQDRAARDHARNMLTTILTVKVREQSTLVVTSSRVRSLTTKGKNKDATGTVKRIKEDLYAPGSGVMVAEVDIDGGDAVRWIPVRSLQVLNPRLLYTPAEVTARAAGLSQRSWPELVCLLGLRDGKPAATMR
jgi:hypothetical protein